MNPNWPNQKLGDLLETCDAGVWGKHTQKGNGLLVLRSTNITNEGDLDFSNVAELNIQDKIGKLKLLDGDILLEKSGGGPDQPVGRVAYFVAPNHRVYSFANFIQRIRPKPDLIDSRFLFYRLLLLHKIGFTKKLQSQTTGIRNLKLSLYLKTEIPLPPLKIQKQIVERMDKIVEVQKLNDELIQKADELFQSLLHKELNPTGKNWETLMLKDTMRDISDGNYSSKYPHQSEFVKSGIPFIRANNFKDGIIAWDDMRFISTQKHKELAKGHLKVDDVLIVTRGEIGNVAFVLEEFNDANINAQIVRINSGNLVTNRFVFYMLQTESLKKQIYTLTTGTTLKQLPVTNLRKIKIHLPSMEIQKRIVEKLSAAQEYKKQLLEQRSKLKELFDSVLHKSMTPRR